MSFEIDGRVLQPDYKAKERTLYGVIAQKDAEIARLQQVVFLRESEQRSLANQLADVREELRALKAKERRRAVKRKKAAE